MRMLQTFSTGARTSATAVPPCASGLAPGGSTSRTMISPAASRRSESAGMGRGGGVDAVTKPLSAARPSNPTDTRKMVIVTARMATRRFCLRMRLGCHLMADVPGEREDCVAGVHAQRRGQDGRVGDVQPVHVPGAAERIHDVAP